MLRPAETGNLVDAEVLVVVAENVLLGFADHILDILLGRVLPAVGNPFAEIAFQQTDHFMQGAQGVQLPAAALPGAIPSINSDAQTGGTALPSIPRSSARPSPW